MGLISSIFKQGRSAQVIDTGALETEEKFEADVIVLGCKAGLWLEDGLLSTSLLRFEQLPLLWHPAFS